MNPLCGWAEPYIALFFFLPENHSLGHVAKLGSFLWLRLGATRDIFMETLVATRSIEVEREVI